MTIFVKPVKEEFQIPVAKVTVAAGRFSFIKRGYVPYLVIFFLASKHSKTLSKPSSKFHQDL